MTRSIMFRAIMFGAGIAAIAPITAPTARAQATQDQATALETQINAWSLDLLGTNLVRFHLPVHVSPDGDHYRIETNYALSDPATGATLTGGPASASLSPLDGNRWALDDLALPPIGLTIAPPLPGAADSTTPPILFAASMKAEHQHISGIIDPTLATASTLDDTASALVETATFAASTYNITAAQMSSHYTAAPNQDGTITIHLVSDIAGYAETQTPKAGPPVLTTSDKTHLDLTLGQFSYPNFRDLIHTASAINWRARGPAVALSVQEFVTAAADLLGGLQGEQVLEGFRVSTGSHVFSLKRLALSAGISAPSGKSEWHARVELDGPDSPDIPSALHADLPRHIAIAAHVAGLSKNGSVQMALQDADGLFNNLNRNLANPLTQLLKDGPITLGLDELTVDMGTSALTGSGHIELASLTDITGEGEFRMTGLDELIRRLSTVPRTQTIPFAMMGLTYLKGLGVQQGNQTVWALKFADHALTVNGADMSTEIPGLPTSPTTPELRRQQQQSDHP